MLFTLILLFHLLY